MTSVGAGMISTEVTDIKEMVDRLHDMLVYATVDYETWYVLKAKEYRDRFQATMLKHTDYFLAAARAHHLATVVGVYGMHEDRDDTFNVPSLLRAIGKLPHVPTGVHDELERRQLTAKKIWIKVGKIRNTVFGHKSRKYTTDQAYQRAALTADELKDILHQTRELLNFAATHVYGTGYASALHPTESAVRMLEALQAGTRAEPVPDARILE
jgi:hypothetical protein